MRMRRYTPGRAKKHMYSPSRFKVSTFMPVVSTFLAWVPEAMWLPRERFANMAGFMAILARFVWAGVPVAMRGEGVS